MTKIDAACSDLALSLKAARVILSEGQEPLQRRLAWLAAELERLASEAYRLADEAGDDPQPQFDGLWPGLDPEPKE